MVQTSLSYEKAYNFAIMIVKHISFYKMRKKNDFSAKISIAYKECLETKYWLSLLKDTNYIDEKMFSSTFSDADEISKMLFSTIKTTRINKTKSEKQ